MTRLNGITVRVETKLTTRTLSRVCQEGWDGHGSVTLPASVIQPTLCLGRAFFGLTSHHLDHRSVVGVRVRTEIGCLMVMYAAVSPCTVFRCTDWDSRATVHDDHDFQFFVCPSKEHVHHHDPQPKILGIRGLNVLDTLLDDKR